MIPRPVEVELKYLVADVATAEWLLAAPSFGPFAAAAGASVTRLEDRYLDTAGGALERAGYAGRLRGTSDVTVLTLKSTATAAGPLQRRVELEAPASPSLDPGDWPASEPRTLLLEQTGVEPLVELVRIRQARTRRDLTAPDAAVELSLDEVEVIAGGAVVDRFVEVEAELREGSEERLAELAAVLGARPGLVPAGGSKLERAQSAVRRARAAAVGDGNGSMATGSRAR